MSRAVAKLYVGHADASLSRHFAGPEGTCDWCTAMWREPAAYPCLPAEIALAIKREYQ